MARLESDANRVTSADNLFAKASCRLCAISCRTLDVPMLEFTEFQAPPSGSLFSSQRMPKKLAEDGLFAVDGVSCI